MSKQHKMAAMSATDLTLRKYRGGGVATKLLLVYIIRFLYSCSEEMQWHQWKIPQLSVCSAI